MKIKGHILIITKLLIIITTSCTPNIYKIAHSGLSPQPSYREKEKNYTLRFSSDNSSTGNSFSYTDKTGKTTFFSEAYKDTTTGETLSMRHLDNVIISAQSNNVAEREGIITLGFVITVPPTLLSSNWQTIVTPVLLSDTSHTKFDEIIISGDYFKSSQIKGYNKYLSYIGKIIDKPESDLTCFAKYRDLANFLERNLPGSEILSGKKNNSLQTTFGVNESEIVKNYMKRQKINRNRKRIENKPNAFRRYVKTPFLPNCRLDSVIADTKGNFLYYYQQDINALDKIPTLKLWLETRIRSRYGSSVSLSCSDTIKYKSTSVSTLADTTTRYIKKIINKKVRFKFKTNFTFPVGQYKIDSIYKENLSEIKKCDSILAQITNDSLYIPYKIQIISYSSPDGKFNTNKNLSQKRANSISSYICSRLTHFKATTDIEREIQSVAENWKELRTYLENSQLLNKERLIKCFDICDLDKREAEMKKYIKSYPYIRDSIYPRLRSATVTLYLSRKDMIKDTIHTTERDTLYMKAIRHLKEKKYNKAAKILDRYRDINAALAHISLGNYSIAAAILNENPPSALKYYLQAILLAREGKEQEAATFFIKAKEHDIRMAYRGPLDPEINSLIIKYNLNKDLFE